LTGHIVRTGDLARDVLELIMASEAPRRSVQRRTADGVPRVFATLHRAELTDDRTRLAGVMTALENLGCPVTFPVHPRTRTRLDETGFTQRPGTGLRLTAPSGYVETLAGVCEADVVITDSGGVQREAFWLGVPCVTIRAYTEWVETVALGANRLVDPAHAASDLPGAVADALRSPRDWPRDVYGTGNAAKAIADAIDRTGLPGRTSS
jgi:UDP-N-acetylglucosamine 2-epimerase